ncbi:2,3,4,5-tetrahydropyridine-2,6-dicarboxylate N-acetyltransferase [subsurface metagenome]
MSSHSECNSLLQAFYYDEMDRVKSFGWTAILNFLLSTRYQAVVLLRWQRIFHLRATEYAKRKGKVNAFLSSSNIYLRRIVERVNSSFNGGIDVSPLAQIGRYLFITSPTGVTLAGDCVIGEHLEVHQGVNIGEKNGKYPTIGNNVYVGSAAHILGDVNVGDNAVIGAMTLVIKDVAPNSVVAGVPARVIRTIGEG